MSWNYRVVRGNNRGETFYDIREVYYDADGGIRAMTYGGVRAMGDSPDELKGDLNLMLKAFEKDILEDIH